MKASRVAAVGLIVGAAAWIASGKIIPHETGESAAAVQAGASETRKPFRVSVMEAVVTPRSRKLTLSGRTEADRKVMAVARTNGILTDLRVRRGQVVKAGEAIAVLSDEAREAQVAQARAALAQRKAELDARRLLVERGTMPRLDLGNLEAQYKAAEAQLASAEAERERGLVTAPWSGVVNEVPAEVGQALTPGKEIAQIVALDPMLAVVEVAERKLAGLRLGEPAEIRLVSGETAAGRIRYVSKTASPGTRTYRVDVEIPNAEGRIPDGITCEIAVRLAEVPAVRMPRSALTFSSAGELGVRIVAAGGKVAFVPVAVVEDEQQFMWVGGVPDGARVIVQGQDFVREGQVVEPVKAAESGAPRTALR
ncbi:MAG: efflux transporter periplasmic adaptor subunit [Bradyrhizobiaceae bacterium]|nr:MAG: efflux transporter periplasmic adaptor subunit [Bradyrhizobiaceae bacterium]